jgi:hypothetical protein
VDHVRHLLGRQVHRNLVPRQASARGFSPDAFSTTTPIESRSQVITVAASPRIAGRGMLALIVHLQYG